MVLINQQYFPEVVSTAQVFQTLAQYLATQDFDVTVVCGTPFYPGTAQRAPKREVLGGVAVRRLWNTCFSKSSFAGKLFNQLSFMVSLFFYALFSIPREATVLVTTAPPLAVVCVAIGRFFRRYRVVMTVQDLYPDVLVAAGQGDARKLSYRILRRIMRMSMHACDQVITISTDMRQHLRAAYGLDRVALIPNLSPGGVHALPVREAKQERGWEDKLVVQYSGNFGVAHEYKTLLDVIWRLQHRQDILFHISGAGSNYDRLKGESQDLPNVCFEGYAPLERLEWHLGAADLSVVIFNEAFRNILMPSKYYGILASGRGVLLISGAQSDISRDIAAESIGLHFGHGEGAAIAQALEELAEDRGRLRDMGHRARALYDRRYQSEPILQAYRDALRA